jgi:hypothetical protein
VYLFRSTSQNVSLFLYTWYGNFFLVAHVLIREERNSADQRSGSEPLMPETQVCHPFPMRAEIDYAEQCRTPCKLYECLFNKVVYVVFSFKFLSVAFRIGPVLKTCESFRNIY